MMSLLNGKGMITDIVPCPRPSDVCSQWPTAAITIITSWLTVLEHLLDKGGPIQHIVYIHGTVGAVSTIKQVIVQLK